MAPHSQATFLSIEDYLAGEEQSDGRYEYIGGRIYAMTGASARHNLIATNLVTVLRPQLRGTSCRLFVADMKLRLTFAGQDIFYYPDLMVCCDPDDRAVYYRTRPSRM